MTIDLISYIATFDIFNPYIPFKLINTLFFGVVTVMFAVFEMRKPVDFTTIEQAEQVYHVEKYPDEQIELKEPIKPNISSSHFVPIKKNIIYLISVEGFYNSGRTSFMKKMDGKTFKEFDVLSIFFNYDSNILNLMQKSYKNPDKYSFELYVAILFSKLKQIKLVLKNMENKEQSTVNKPTVILIDGSWESDTEIFAKTVRNLEYFDNDDMNMLTEILNDLQFPKIDGYIGLHTEENLFLQNHLTKTITDTHSLKNAIIKEKIAKVFYESNQTTLQKYMSDFFTGDRFDRSVIINDRKSADELVITLINNISKTSKNI